jgi:pyruvate dehydrogenase E2 component (dihydrolipoamide acetyltransferase)
MPTEIKLPELGENLTSGDVLEVRVKPGDAVKEGQTLLEVEAEKSTVEVPSPVAGKVAKLLVKKGDTIEVGQTLCWIDAADGQASGPPTASVREASTAKLAAEPARRTERGGGPEPAPPPERLAPTGESEERGNGKHAGDAPRPAARQPAPSPADREAPGEATAVPAGPATRRLARELGVAVERVAGTGPHGRITPDDVKEYVKELASGDGAATVAAPPLPDFERWGAVERQPLDAIRRKTAEQMSLAWRLIPHVTQHDVADITELEAFRKHQSERGPKLTVTAFALKAVAIALQQFPQFNSSLDTAAGQLIVKNYYHLGVAVDTERGLLVPVLRDVDRKSVAELAQELTDIAERARQKKLSADEMRGGTFTITNLGGIGGTAFTPIINYPEVAILGLSRARLEPVVRDGAVTPRLLLPLSLSYDHRVIDGAGAARFTRRVAEFLESPLMMLLHA